MDGTFKWFVLVENKTGSARLYVREQGDKGTLVPLNSFQVDLFRELVAEAIGAE
jgi:hypothetical protein